MKQKEGKHIKKLESKKREITLILIVGIVITLFFTGYSLGKETSNTKIEGTAQVAKPILIVENNPSIDITAKNEKSNYDFKIKNYENDNQINQIALSYTIEILSKTNKAIEFKLYQEEREIPLENQITPIFHLAKDQKQEKNYRLEILYDKNQTGSIEEILQDVQIKVHSEQEKSKKENL